MLPQDVLDHYKSLTDQALKLFGAQHFRDYHFLYSLSDHVAHFGLEHHESNDSREGERALIDPSLRLLAAGLLTHEYVHSWNGKYRRPFDLATPDYEQPMKTDLLWVYEGLTSYLGDVLSGRTGIRTPDQFFNDSLAYIAASSRSQSGPHLAQFAGHCRWSSRRCKELRRSGTRGGADSDYYEEDVLNWLWVDTIIRQQTNGQKSHR